MTDARRRIPSLDRLLEADALGPLRAGYPRERLADVLRAVLEEVRREAAENADEAFDPGDPALYADRARRVLERQAVASLRRVVNATGVVLHTNLGRAPLAAAARDAMARVSSYSNLEFDLDSGARGSRYVHCASLVGELTGAEDALVVNNNAAALVLAVNTLARGGTVLVSRGELVEIGGGFRIPDMLERSGATLVEVGSTNRTRLNDYRAAAEAERPSLVLKVHRSNFRITGFTEEASLRELSEMAGTLGVPLLHDLGSGLLADPAPLGLPAEPSPADSLREGADLVAFSGDKLLGGPQAGLIAGRGELVARLRQNPLCRAFRVDKATLGALEATLRLYRDPDEARRQVPVLAMLSRSSGELEARARRLVERLVERGMDADTHRCSSVVGGGTYPGARLDSWAVRLTRPDGVSRLAAALRGGDPPVVGRIEDDALLLDLRTVDPDEDGILASRLFECWADLPAPAAPVSTRSRG